MPLFELDIPCTEKTVNVLCDILMDKYKPNSVERFKCVNYDDIIQQKSIKIPETFEHVFFSCIEQQPHYPDGIPEYNLIQVDNANRNVIVYDFSCDTEKSHVKCKNISKRILSLKKNNSLWRYDCVHTPIDNADRYLCGFMVPYMLEVVLNDIKNGNCFNLKLHKLYFIGKRLVKYAIMQIRNIVDSNCLYNTE